MSKRGNLKSQQSSPYNNNPNTTLDNFYNFAITLKALTVQPQDNTSTFSNLLLCNNINTTFSNNQDILNTTFASDQKTNEDFEFQSYLKEYQALKHSRISNQTQENEMKELISQFLSNKTVSETPIKKPTASFKTSQIKVSKIDLNAFQQISKKSNGLKPNNTNKSFHQSGKIIEKSPRFTQSNIQQNIKVKNKKNIQIVKVKNITPSLLLKQKQIKISKKHPEQPQRVIQNGYLANINKTSYKYSYSLANQSKNKPQQKKAEQNLPNKLQRYIETHTQPNKQHKKPIRIQIEIPTEQLQLSPQQVRNYSVQSSIQLQNEQQQIIRQISKKVMTLLKREKTTPQKRQKI